MRVSEALDVLARALHEDQLKRVLQHLTSLQLTVSAGPNKDSTTDSTSAKLRELSRASLVEQLTDASTELHSEPSDELLSELSSEPSRGLSDGRVDGETPKHPSQPFSGPSDDPSNGSSSEPSGEPSNEVSNNEQVCKVSHNVIKSFPKLTLVLRKTDQELVGFPDWKDDDIRVVEGSGPRNFSPIRRILSLRSLALEFESWYSRSEGRKLDFPQLFGGHAKRLSRVRCEIILAK